MRLPKTSCNYQERPESYETLAFPVLVHDCVFRVVDKMTGDVFGSLDESQTSGVPWQSLAALWGSWEARGRARGGGSLGGIFGCSSEHLESDSDSWGKPGDIGLRLGVLSVTVGGAWASHVAGVQSQIKRIHRTNLKNNFYFWSMSNSRSPPLWGCY